MAPAIVHLPNGQTLTVTPVFAGIQFRANELNTHHNAFPPGWTIVINSEDDENEDKNSQSLPPPSVAAHTLPNPDAVSKATHASPKKHVIHRFRKPSLRNDHLFISAISNPSSSEFRPASSATRQIAMMLWATLWWYFHQPQPSPYLTNAASATTPEEGKPKGDWRVNINREGIFKGKHLLPKLERMGLIASEDSSVGLDPDDGVTTSGESWAHMFASQRSFWQLDARIYLFTIAPTQPTTPYPSLSPAHSRPSSPSRNSTNLSTTRADAESATSVSGHIARSNTPPGPFTSSSHLPTFYPPPPPQYTFTNGVRHPIRPKPPRQGETFYTRYIPSLGQYLSFRVASLSKSPCRQQLLTFGSSADTILSPAIREALRNPTHTSLSDSAVPTMSGLSLQDPPAASETTNMCDTELLHKWMNDPRVAYSWGEDGPVERQEEFLRMGLASKHSFPVIGCFDGKPFAYFEIYWVKEDRLSAHLDGCGDWDRGFHLLVGEQEFRGSHRVKVWLSALVHYCWLADMRTNVVMLEPRADNVKLRNYCEQLGFFREKEITFPHKQSNLMKIKREAWTAPAL